MNKPVFVFFLCIILHLPISAHAGERGMSAATAKIHGKDLSALSVLSRILPGKPEVRPAREEPRDNPENDDVHVKSDFPDLYYEIQIACLNVNTELDLFYNEEVRYYIDLFLKERPGHISVFLHRSQVYFPMFERYLKDYGLPVEMKYLAVLESGLSPFACSPSMAAGLWQFKEKTAGAYGLNVDEYYDERLDPESSTIAACKYLADLFRHFGSWHLALLAYNAGPTTLKRAIQKSGNNSNYEEIYPYLTPAAKKYLPALIAIIYLMNNHLDHFYQASGA